MAILIAVLFTLVIYEPSDLTFEIDVYDYSESPTIDVVCPEGIYESDCLEPRVKKRETAETISLEDIQDCANNNNFF